MRKHLGIAVAGLDSISSTPPRSRLRLYARGLSILIMLFAVILAGSEAWARQGASDPWSEPGATGTGTFMFSQSTGPVLPEIAVDSSGNPVIAWSQYLNGTSRILVRRWNGSAWAELGESGTTGLDAGNAVNIDVSIAVNSSGNPIVAWCKRLSTSATNYEIYLRRWNGTIWEELAGSGSGGGVSDSPGSSLRPCVAVDPWETPWVAWQETPPNGNPNIQLRRWTGSAWEAFGESANGAGITEAIRLLNSLHPTLAINSSGNPVVAGMAVSPGGIYLIRWNGTAWEELGGSATDYGISGPGAEIAQNPSLALGPSGNPVVAWQDENIGGPEEIYLRRWNGTEWEELDGSGSSGGLSKTAGFSEFPVVAVDSSGNPVVAWMEDLGSGANEIYVRRWNGQGWVEVDGSATGGGVSNMQANSTYPTMAIAPSGDIFVAWGEIDYGVGTWDSIRRWKSPHLADAQQLEGPAMTVLPVGASTDAAQIVFRATVSRDLPSSLLRLQVELRRDGDEFTGVASAQSLQVTSGNVATISVSGLAPGEWRWRARVADASGAESAWRSFGGNPESAPDFKVLMAPVVAAPLPASSGGGKKSQCGLLGIEGPLIVAALAWLRRRRRRLASRRATSSSGDRPRD